MHPFWNQLVKLYPMWLAPNILTFVGFLCLVINFLTFSVYDFHFYGLCPDVSNCTKEAQLNSYKLFQQETNYDYSRLSLYLCSCIPSYLWLLSGVAQFLGHHLGKSFFFFFIIIISLKHSNSIFLIFVCFNRWNRRKTS